MPRDTAGEAIMTGPLAGVFPPSSALETTRPTTGVSGDCSASTTCQVVVVGRQVGDSADQEYYFSELAWHLHEIIKRQNALDYHRWQPEGVSTMSLGPEKPMTDVDPADLSICCWVC
jgi:hypothetical protein